MPGVSIGVRDAAWQVCKQQFRFVVLQMVMVETCRNALYMHKESCTQGSCSGIKADGTVRRDHEAFQILGFVKAIYMHGVSARRRVPWQCDVRRVCSGEEPNL